MSSDGEEGDGYAGSSAQCGTGRAWRRACGLWGTVGEGFAPRRGAARASWLRVWASPCRGGERTSGIRRRRALWRAESDEGRACTSRSSTQVVSPRAGTRCVPGLRRTWPARARNAAHRARACCRAWPRAVLMHSARFWFRAARILGDQTSCQWPGGMWGCEVVLTQISPTRTFWSLAHSYILGGGKLVLKIKMSGAERFWCLRSLLASVASPCARTATWLVSSESPRPALSCRLSHVTLAAL